MLLRSGPSSSSHGSWSWTQRQRYETTPQRFMTLRHCVTMSSGNRTRGLTPVAGGQSSSTGRRMPMFTPERVLAMVRYVISRPVKSGMRQGSHLASRYMGCRSRPTLIFSPAVAPHICFLLICCKMKDRDLAGSEAGRQYPLAS
jgi:hypothetical protein